MLLKIIIDNNNNNNTRTKITFFFTNLQGAAGQSTNSNEVWRATVTINGYCIQPMTISGARSTICIGATSTFNGIDERRCCSTICFAAFTTACDGHGFWFSSRWLPINDTCCVVFFFFFLVEDKIRFMNFIFYFCGGRGHKKHQFWKWESSS